jgi:hypothetical protein
VGQLAIGLQKKQERRYTQENEAGRSEPWEDPEKKSYER